MVSKNFTGYDGWASPGRGGLCPACVWAYSTPQLRAQAHVVSRDGPALVALRPSALLVVLRAGALEGGCAVAVPLHPGRKHVITHAVWGRVATESGSMPWRTGDVERLDVVLRLRHAGFGPRMIAARAPAYPVLRRLPPRQIAAVLRDWTALEPWRRGGAWLDLALHTTTASAKR